MSCYGINRIQKSDPSIRKLGAVVDPHALQSLVWTPIRNLVEIPTVV